MSWLIQFRLKPDLHETEVSDGARCAADVKSAKGRLTLERFR